MMHAGDTTTYELHRNGLELFDLDGASLGHVRTPRPHLYRELCDYLGRPYRPRTLAVAVAHGYPPCTTIDGREIPEPLAGPILAALAASVWTRPVTLDAYDLAER